jgi:hypothetical protein
LLGTEEQKMSVLPLLREGEASQSFPPLLLGRVFGNVTNDRYYFITLFDLILTINNISFRDPVVHDLRVKLREEEQTLLTTDQLV